MSRASESLTSRSGMAVRRSTLFGSMIQRTRFSSLLTMTPAT